MTKKLEIPSEAIVAEARLQILNVCTEYGISPQYALSMFCGLIVDILASFEWDSKTKLTAFEVLSSKMYNFLKDSEKKNKRRKNEKN